MTERLTLQLWEPAQAHKAIQAAWNHAKPLLMAGNRMVVELKPASRTTDQNARLHASIADIARQKEWAGKKWDTESWKRLLTAAWCRANAEGVEMVPAIDGAGFDVLYRRTSKLSKRECSDLLEFIYAWGAEHDVVFSDPVPEGWMT